MKNKILTISIIFILLTFVFISNNVFATSLSDYPDFPVPTTVGGNSPNNYRRLNYIYLGPNNNTFLVSYFYTYVSNKKPVIIADEAITYNYTGSSTYYYTYILNNDDSTWSSYDNGTSESGNTISHTPYYDIYYSEIDIYNKSGDIVFQVPPVQQRVVAQKLEGVEMKEPIITTIVGLAKLLIPFLICLIGFWKGWQLLLKILHKS